MPQRVGSSSSSTSSRFYRQFGSYQRRHSSLTGRDVRRQFLPLKLNFSGASYDQTTDRHSTSLPYLSSDNQQRPQPVYPSNRIRIYNGTHTKRIYSEAYDVMELQAPAGKQSDYTARAIANVGIAPGRPARSTLVGCLQIQPNKFPVDFQSTSRTHFNKIPVVYNFIHGDGRADCKC